MQIIQLIFITLLCILVGLNIHVENYGVAAFVFCALLFNLTTMSMNS